MDLFENIKVNKDIPIPLYYQLKKQIIEKIEDHTLKVGDMIPPENEFCVRLGISRPTVRQSFGELVAEGYLTRMKGKGTFVYNAKLSADFLQKLNTFNEEIQNKGMIPSTKVLSLKKVTNIPDVSEKLRLPLDAPMIYLRRVRCANGEIVMYQEAYLPYDLFPNLLNKDFETQSLRAALKEEYGIGINRATKQIAAVNATQKDAAILRVETGKAISLVRTVNYAENISAPVEYTISRFRGDRVTFNVDMLK